MQFVGNGDIVGMVSREGEVVPLKTRIKPSLADGAVEKWLVQVRNWLALGGSDSLMGSASSLSCMGCNMCSNLKRATFRASWGSVMPQVLEPGRSGMSALH